MTPEPSDKANTDTNADTNADALKDSKGSVWQGHLGSLAFAVDRKSTRLNSSH